MKHMDRILLLSVLAATAFAQQQPAPGAKEAEAALRARAEQFFQLQVERKYRQAEALVADDTKDTYYNGDKFNIKNFTIEKIDLLDGNTRAKVMIKAKVTLITPTAPPMDFDAPSTTLWKVENGKWVWYVDKVAALKTPFGVLKPGTTGGTGTPASLSGFGKVPDLATLRTLVKVDRKSVELKADGPVESVNVTNDLPGGIELQLRPDRVPGLSAELAKKELKAGEKTVIYLRASAGGKGDGLVRLLVAPIQAEVDIHVSIH